MHKLTIQLPEALVFRDKRLLSHSGKQFGIRVHPWTVYTEEHAGGGIEIRVQVFQRGNIIYENLRVSAFEIIHTAFAIEIGAEFAVADELSGL